MRDLDGEHAGEAFAHVVAFRVDLRLLREFVLRDVVLQHARERGAKPRDVRAAVALRNVVRVGREDFVVPVLPLHGDFDVDRHAVARHGFARVEDLRVKDVPRAVLEFDVGDETLFRFEKRLVLRAHVLQEDFDAGIEVRELTQAREQRLVAEGRHLLEDLEVREEVHLRPVAVGLADELHRRDERLLTRLRVRLLFDDGIHHLPAREAQTALFAVAADREVQPRRERVHAGDAHAVQAPGNLVAVVVELAAGMEFGQGDFRGASLRFVLVVPLDRRGNPTAVVDDRNRFVLMDGDLDVARELRERFVDRVVDDFVDEVVQAGAVGGVADVHARTLANRFKAFKNLNARFVVARRGFGGRLGRLFDGLGRFGDVVFSFSHGSGIRSFARMTVRCASA